MEGGRQADVAKGILTAKNVPYIIAAPLLIQVCHHTACPITSPASHTDMLYVCSAP